MQCDAMRCDAMRCDAMRCCALRCQLCGTTPCMVCGSEEIKKTIEDHLHIKVRYYSCSRSCRKQRTHICVVLHMH
jgi:hypothetical protein